MNKYRYKNLFIYSTLQFCGNVEEYFVENTEKLLVYIVLPRQDMRANMLRVYKKGKLDKEENVPSSSNMFLYYLYWYFYQVKFMLLYFTGKEKFFLFSGHPISFFGMTVIKLLRKVEYAYWIGDYFPGDSFYIKLFERLKKYYHDRIKYTCYLSDKINGIMNNGEVIENFNRKTVMWGMKKTLLNTGTKRKINFTACFIGVIREDQGLGLMLKSVSKINNLKLKILGPCTKELYHNYQNLIKEYKITNRVYFPNKVFYGKDLLNNIKDCFVGFALYDINRNSPAYFADPAKVKTYVQYGLPVIMTDSSDITKYIKRYNCGEVVRADADSVKEAIINIKKRYSEYKKGLKNFTGYFYYRTYYREKFKFLENNN